MDDGQTDPLRISPDQRVTEPRAPEQRGETDEQAEARMMRALSMMSAGTPPHARPGPQGMASRPAAAMPGGAPGQRGATAGRRTMPQATAAGQNRRHRFVQDGEVPVVNVARPRRDGMPGLPAPARVGETGRPQTDELTVERTARIEAERRFAEIAVQLRSHQTRLGDAELARDAAETELRELRLAVQTLQAENLSLAQSAGRRSATSAEHRSATTADHRAATSADHRSATSADHRAATSADHRAVAGAEARSGTSGAEERPQTGTEQRSQPDLLDHRPDAPGDGRAAETVAEPARRRSRTRADATDGEEPEPVKWWA